MKNVKVVEFFNVSYVEIPHVMLKLKMFGFNISDITKVRINSRKYNIYAVMNQ